MNALLRVEITVPCERFDVALAWETENSALGLFGPSGAGKTSVLEALAGLRKGVRGRIEVGGRTWLDTDRRVELRPEERGVGYVPQEALLFPHLDVLGNLRVGERRALRSAHRPTPERVLDLLELKPLARQSVDRISGGERRRVALGRALCSAPVLLLLDEPLAGLDLPLRRRILTCLLRVREELAIPTLHVSHDPSEAALLAREVTVLEAGRVVGRGAPETLFGGHGLRPGESGEALVNLLHGTVLDVSESVAMVEVAPDLRVAIADDGTLATGQRLSIELRAAEILVARGAASGLSAQNALEAVVEKVHPPDSEDRSTSAVVTCAVGGAGLRISAVVSQRAASELDLGPGQSVRLVFKAQACRVLVSS